MVRGPMIADVTAGWLIAKATARWTSGIPASSASSRRPPARAFPTISSDSPRAYTSAVSMKLMPASSARWMIRTLSSWSVLPQVPNIIAPRQSGLTCTPVVPSGRTGGEEVMRRDYAGSGAVSTFVPSRRISISS